MGRRMIEDSVMETSEALEQIEVAVAESKYNEICDYLEYQVESGDMSAVDAQIIADTAYERYFGESSELRTADNAKVEAFKQSLKAANETVKANVASAKKCAKNKQYDEAISQLNDTKKCLKDMETRVREMPESIKGVNITSTASWICSALTAIFAMGALTSGSQNDNGLRDVQTASGSFAIAAASAQVKSILKAAKTGTADSYKQNAIKGIMNAQDCCDQYIKIFNMQKKVRTAVSGAKDKVASKVASMKNK